MQGQKDTQDIQVFEGREWRGQGLAETMNEV